MTSDSPIDPQASSSQAPGGHSSPHIHDATSETFEQEVMVRSQDVPVVIDFWAPWCDPCRQLAPVLEKLVDEANGRWHLVRIDIDACQDLAMAFQVQSIPLLVAFVDGQPVDSLPGVAPEEGLREWLSRFIPSEVSILVEAGEALEADNPADAAAKYREALSLEPDNAQVKIRLARVAMVLEDHGGARALVSELEQRGYLEPEAEALRDQLELTESATQTGGVAEARKACEEDPSDDLLRVKLAEALATDRQFDEAISICLDVVERDRDGVGQQARDALVTLFGMPTVDAELVSQSRRRLATLLY